MREDAANSDRRSRDPTESAFDAKKRNDAFFDEGCSTVLADQFMARWPDWKYMHLDDENSPEHIEHVLGVICENHPCKPLPKIYQYLYGCWDKDPELGKVKEIAFDADFDDEALYALLKHLTDTGQYAEAKRYCTGTRYAFLEWSSCECADFRFKKIRSLVHYNLKEYDECVEALNEIIEMEDTEEAREILQHVIAARNGAFENQ